jgi:hypothetical protein
MADAYQGQPTSPAPPTKSVGKGRGKKAIDSINIEEAQNGGFIVRLSFDNRGSGESYAPPETHVAATLDALLAHVRSCFGGGKAGS